VLERRQVITYAVPAGRQSISWDGTNQQGLQAVAGVYSLQLQVGCQTQTRQVILAE
jgi:hypothetical protein